LYSYIQNLVIGNSKAQGHSQGQGHHQGGGHNIYFKIICFPTKKSEMQMKKNTHFSRKFENFPALCTRKYHFRPSNYFICWQI